MRLFNIFLKLNLHCSELLDLLRRMGLNKRIMNNEYKLQKNAYGIFKSIIL